LNQPFFQGFSVFVFIKNSGCLTKIAFLKMAETTLEGWLTTRFFIPTIF